LEVDVLDKIESPATKLNPEAGEPEAKDPGVRKSKS